jgi:hydroxymethylglutaryl-CoA lyase
MGVQEIDLADTIGKATPKTTEALLIEARGTLPAQTLLTLHFHDTFGQAIDCVRTALRKGVRSFDAALAGLGGCPYASTEASKAPGNIDTQLLIQAIDNAGYATSINREALHAARETAAAIKQEAAA